jgi:polar amino acid transport system substrate-binding protein
VQESTTGDIYISDEFETAGTADVQRFKNGADAVLALTSGQVDCVVIDNEPAKAFVAKNEGLKLLASAYTEEDYAMAFPLDSEIYETFNAALQELMADGTLQGIVDKFIPAE